MPGRDGLLEELEHVLQDLDARVEQVDALRDLEVAPRRVVQRLEVRVRLSGGDVSAGRSTGSEHTRPQNVRGRACTYPEDFLWGENARRGQLDGMQRDRRASGERERRGYAPASRAPSRPS